MRSITIGSLIASESELVAKGDEDSFVANICYLDKQLSVLRMLAAVHVSHSQCL